MSRDAGSVFHDPDDEKFRPPPPRPAGEPRPADGDLPEAIRVEPARRSRYRRNRYEVGEAISRTFSIWFRSFFPFSLLALLINLPEMLFGLWFLETGYERLPVGAYFAWNLLLGLVMGQLLTAVVIFGVVERLRGRRPTMGACLGRGLARLGPVLLVTLVMMIPFALMAFFVALLGVNEPGATLGLVLLLVTPALMWAVMVFVATPVVVVERPGGAGLGALGRSFRLTSGRRWGLFGTIVVVYLAAGFAAGFINIVAMAAGGLEVGPVSFLVQSILGALVAPLTSTLPAVAYYLLRRDKEGIDVDEIAAVFD